MSSEKAVDEDIFATKKIYGVSQLFDSYQKYKAENDKEGKEEIDRRQERIITENLKILSNAEGNLTFECWSVDSLRKKKCHKFDAAFFFVKVLQRKSHPTSEKEEVNHQTTFL